MKTCPTCKFEKSLTDFSKDSSRKDGHKSRCKKCCYAEQKVYEATSAGKARQARSWKKRNYGIGTEEYDKLLLEQDGKCAICQDKPKVLCIDHCHKTGTVRGLLCHRCNCGIGLLRDDIVIVRSAAKYLE